MIKKAAEAFSAKFGKAPEFIVQAPGRVNLIGEHTDYNNGFVLPMAIDRCIWIALQARNDQLVKLHSLDFPNPAEFSLINITHGEGWSEYIRGMAWILSDLGLPLLGWKGVLTSNIPIASGLSSSATLELAAARAFWSTSPWEWDGAQMAQASQRMENEWLNLNSGIMDQMISACGKAQHALLIDCRDLNTELVPFPQDVSIVVMDTGVQRGLIDSEYNERVSQCQIAAEYFGMQSLRDVTMNALKQGKGGLDPLIYRRAHHVISENQRTQQAAMAMRSSDLSHLAKLINASHSSLRDDYQVSCAELDQLVEIALSHPACDAARMTGAGFGGCAIALVHSSGVSDFINKTQKQFQQIYGYTPQVFKAEASSGAN